MKELIAIIKPEEKDYISRWCELTNGDSYRYRCTGCGEEDVLEEHFLFCPNCGIKLKWEIDK